MRNLDLINNLNFDDPPQIYGTAYNKGVKEIDEIKRDYFSYNRDFPELIIEPENCKKLLEKYF